jgi:probable rRNA maturation factor
MKKPKLEVTVRTYQRKWRINDSPFRKFLQNIWIGLHTGRKTPTAAELTVVFLNNKQMQTYNRKYRKKDYPTDVLSFPVNEAVDGKRYLGDLLISVPKAASQALEKGHSLSREIRILLLHGILHLLGYDHETDHGQMERLEQRLQKKFL